MRKNLFILLAFIWLSNVMAQIPADWELVSNEYVVFYENTNAKTNRSADGALSFQYVSLSDNEKNSLVNDPSVALISNVYQQGDTRIALTNKLLILATIPIQTLLYETGVASQVQKTDSICFGERLTIYVVTLNTKDPLVEYEKVRLHPGCKAVEINYLMQTPKQQTQSIQERSINYQQWALDNEDYPLFDINIDWAWSVTKGEGVKIAVIDEGIDLDHIDLEDNLLPGYDMTDGMYGGADGGYSGFDNHGTQCAGVIAALDNNEGIVGVAPQAKIIPIRGAYADAERNWVTHQGIWLVHALEKAFAENVEVISNSWGLQAPSTMFNTILETISQFGRNGKGTIVTFAAGNYNQSVLSTPSWHSGVLAVGASKKNGRRWEDSNFGNGLDVVAPGENIYTTTIQDFYKTESGTSIACPHVAAIAALMLAVNPDLTREEVHEIICSTAYKLPHYDFDSIRPYGSWNREVGYGLVDASAAVYSAWAKRFTLVGPDSLCQSARYYITNVPDYAHVQWFKFGFQHFNPDWVDLIDSTNINLPIRKLRLSTFWTDTVIVKPGENLGIAIDGYYEPIPYSGYAELQPQVVYNGKKVSLSKQLYVREQLNPEIQANISFFPDMEEDAPEHLLVGVSYYFKSALFPNENDLQWTIVMTGDTVTGVGIQSPIIIAGYDSIFVSVFNPNTDECISNSLSTKLYTTMEFVGMDFANPVDDMVDIQVAHTLPSNTQARNMTLRTANIEPLLYKGECEIELWDMYRGKLRTVTGKDGYVQMPLQDVAPGNYVLRLIIDGQQVDSKPLMVR